MADRNKKNTWNLSPTKSTAALLAEPFDTWDERALRGNEIFRRESEIPRDLTLTGNLAADSPWQLAAQAKLDALRRAQPSVAEPISERERLDAEIAAQAASALALQPVRYAPQGI